MRGYTGGLMERELLGSAEIAPMPKEYIKLKDGMKLIKEYQPFDDPSEPDPQFADDLHATVADQLNLEDYTDLRFYTAVGTVVDRMGVDAFMELDFKGRTFFVTLDVTTNPTKDVHKADIVFFVPSDGLDPKIDKEEYMQKIQEVSDSVVDKFKYYIERYSDKVN